MLYFGILFNELSERRNCFGNLGGDYQKSSENDRFQEIQKLFVKDKI
jgi:hypothetical protein